MSIVLHEVVVSKFLLCSLTFIRRYFMFSKIAPLYRLETRNGSAIVIYGSTLATSSCKTTGLKLLFKPNRLLVD